MELAAGILLLAGKASGWEEGRALASGQLHNGRAFETFRAMVRAQGGNGESLSRDELLPHAPVRRPIRAETEGFLTAMNTQQIGAASVKLGAGREKKEDAIDYGAGILLRKKTGDHVHAGDMLAELFASSEARCEAAEQTFRSALRFSETIPPSRPIVLGRVGF